MTIAKKAPIPGWRTMTAAQRRNAQYARIWEAAKDAKTRFNASSREESDNRGPDRDEWRHEAAEAQRFK